MHITVHKMLWPTLRIQHTLRHSCNWHCLNPYAEVYSASRHRHRLSSHACRTGDLSLWYFLSLTARACARAQGRKWLILRITVTVVYPGIVYVQVQLYGDGDKSRSGVHIKYIHRAHSCMWRGSDVLRHSKAFTYCGLQYAALSLAL